MPRHSLLIVDQDVYYAQIYAKRLEAAGWKVSVEENVSDARKRVKRSVPDVVIVDIDPLDSALTFFRDLRLNPETAKIIQVALATRTDRQIMEEVLLTGVDRFIMKGHLSPSEVVKHLKRLIEEKTV